MRVSTTIGLSRLACSIPTLICSCSIYYVFKIKADSFWKRYLSYNRLLGNNLFEFACLRKRAFTFYHHSLFFKQYLLSGFIARINLQNTPSINLPVFSN